MVARFKENDRVRIVGTTNVPHAYRIGMTGKIANVVRSGDEMSAAAYTFEADNGARFLVEDHLLSLEPGNELSPVRNVALRDWFAGLALQVYLTTRPIDATYDEAAEKAYRMADAMLAARKVQP